MYVKVCGITHLDDARAAIDAGVDVLGFNLIPESKRSISPEQARAIVEQVHDRVICIAVVANLPPPDCLELRARSGCERLQLHGDEPPADLHTLSPHAFKAVRIGNERDVELASSYPGHPLLVDAKVPGQLGGTGHRLDLSLVVNLAASRPLILAGGLGPDSVEDAVRRVQPWGVDVASGVETDSDPRRKDADKMHRFVEAARRSARARHVTRF